LRAAALRLEQLAVSHPTGGAFHSYLPCEQETNVRLSSIDIINTSPKFDAVRIVLHQNYEKVFSCVVAATTAPMRRFHCNVDLEMIGDIRMSVFDMKKDMKKSKSQLARVWFNTFFVVDNV
jgi:hypothetical protein